MRLSTSTERGGQEDEHSIEYGACNVTNGGEERRTEQRGSALHASRTQSESGQEDMACIALGTARVGSEGPTTHGHSTRSQHTVTAHGHSTRSQHTAMYGRVWEMPPPKSCLSSYLGGVRVDQRDHHAAAHPVACVRPSRQASQTPGAGWSWGWGSDDAREGAREVRAAGVWGTCATGVLSTLFPSGLAACSSP